MVGVGHGEVFYRDVGGVSSPHRRSFDEDDRVFLLLFLFLASSLAGAMCLL